VGGPSEDFPGITLPRGNGTVIVVNETGARVVGSYVGDKVAIGFTVGSTPFFVDRFGFTHSLDSRFYGCGGYGYGGHWGGYWGDRYPSYYRGPIYGFPAQVDPFVQAPAPAPTAPPAPPRSPLDLADEAMREGAFGEALSGYREHLLASERDAEVMRRYALALLLTRKPAEAVAVMAMAYEIGGPALAATPLDATLVPGSALALRDRTSAAVNHANNTKTGSSWLTVVVLMQAGGRNDAALKLLPKAKAAGLDAQLAKAFERALRR
jgi:hypothetical protein